MAEAILDSSAQGVSLMELARLSAMLAGAVSATVVAWLARRNIVLAFCSFILGLLGGMSMGTGMGRLCFCYRDGAEYVVQTGWSAWLASGLAGLAGSIPSALVTSVVIGFLTMRHYKQRPPRVRTALTGFIAGVLAATASAIVLGVI